MAWLTGYSYCKKNTWNGATGAGTDYQVKLFIGKTSGATGENFDLEGHCLDTMLDMRFTDNDGTTLLSYWIEKVEASGTSYLATVYVKVADSLESGTVDFYVYYGKTGDTSGSSGANTFIQYHGSATATFIDAYNSPPTNIAYEAKVRRVDNSSNLEWGLNRPETDRDGYAFQTDSIGGKVNIYNVLNYPAGTGHGYSTANEAPALVKNQWYRIKITSNGTISHFYRDDDEVGSGLNTYIPDSNMGLYFTETSENGEQEFSFTRKWVVTEPTFSTAGAEEGESTNIEVTPSAVNSTFAVVSPTVSAVQNIAVSPSVQNSTFATVAPTITTVRNIAITPSVVNATFATVAQTVTAIQNIGVAPTVENATFAINAPAISAIRNASISPVVQNAVFAIPAIAVSAVRNIETTPAIQNAVFAIGTPTITAIQTSEETPSLLNAVFTLPAVSVSVQSVPSVVLNTAEAYTTYDTTPTLEFTGTDLDGDDIEYELQISTVNTFD